MSSRSAPVHEPVPGAPVRRLETALVEALVDGLGSYLRRTATVYTEVVAGRSIADVVAVIQDDRHPPHRPLTAWESALLAALRQVGPTRIDILENACGLAPGALREESDRFDRLLKSGLVRRGRGGSVQIGTTWGRSFRMIAIEAKLTRWRQALDQAVEYRRFADLAYVALPDLAIPQARRERELFEATGVGLLAVNGHVRTVVRAQSAKDHDWRREFLWSRLGSDVGAC